MVTFFVSTNVLTQNNAVMVAKWGEFGDKPGQFKYPTMLATDKEANIYVVDQHNHRIQKFDSDGKFIAKWGNGRGSADNQFKRPEDITFTSNAIFVTDTGNNRVLKFDKNFTLITKWGTKGTGDGQFVHPHAIDVDSARLFR